MPPRRSRNVALGVPSPPLPPLQWPTPPALAKLAELRRVDARAVAAAHDQVPATVK
ncbi:MAG: hypothetical protein H6835_19045 [Planctomycetes bacterium]|nr:hypothetical protein [Planctomycetota bacterium]